VGATWGTLEGRLTYVGGKRLLAAMRERIQSRHGVSFGNERLAEAFDRTTIHPEVIDALQKIEALR